LGNFDTAIDFDELTGTTTVEHTITVVGGTGFTRFNLPSTFAALSSVSWTPNAVLVDNIVPTLLTFGTPAAAIAAIPTFTTSTSITFNTDTNQLTQGQINIDTDRNGTIDRTLVCLRTNSALASRKLLAALLNSALLAI
jgi:hypothetical protein